MKQENSFDYWWNYYVDRHGFDGSLEEANAIAENVFYEYHARLLEQKIENGKYIINPEVKELFISNKNLNNETNKT